MAETEDIVDRLRRLAKPALLPSLQAALEDAANEIERLRAKAEILNDIVVQLGDDLGAANTR